ncbi:MAG: DUF1573 domain-containing protein [Bacteroidales bacterium]
MKKIFFLLIASLLVVPVLNAQNNNAERKGPIITFDQKLRDASGNYVWDYGTIQQGADGSSFFAFKNTGTEPLVLSEVRSSCGCTVPRWPREPILPGKSDTIKVKYDTKRLGQINKTITVISNAVNNPVVLRIKGDVIAKPAEVVPEKASGAVVPSSGK